MTSSQRKLQGEVDKVLKKVNEGITEFDNILNKIHTSSTTNQKEKYECDLKKEIKKLQRHRELIKSWLSGNEVKNKTPLLDSRKRIETQMEAFKNYERESKTKAFSKEGLQRQREKEKKGVDGRKEITEWLQSVIDRLERQVENIELQIESIDTKKRKNNPDYDEYLRIMARHQVHLNSLERILRLWENEVIARSKIEDIKDSIEYYVESNDEPDFLEDEAIYDDLGLEDVNLDLVSSEMRDEDDRISEESYEFECGNYPESKTAQDTQGTLNTTQILFPDSQESRMMESMNHRMEPRILFPESHKPRDINMQEMDKSKRVMNNPQHYPSQSQMHLKNDPYYRQPSNPMMGTGNMPQPMTHNPNNSMPSQLQQNMSKQSQSQQPLNMKQPLQQHSMHNMGPNDHPMMMLGDTPKITVEQNMATTLAALNSSFVHLNDHSNRKYRPMNPHKTPDFFPQEPHHLFDKPMLFTKFDIETLFFIFYHQQNTKQQYFASRELKRHSWRYHTKYLTWFRRHDEPKIIEKDYEEGTYIYFDYELDNGWCQRKKCEFKFEYRFLEGQGS